MHFIQELDFLYEVSDYNIAGHVLPIRSISRVVYVFGSRVEHEIEFITETTGQTTLLPQHVVAKLQEIDSRAQTILWESGHYNAVAQMPVILIPVVFDVDTVDPNYAGRQHSVVLRPFITNDFMTGIFHFRYTRCTPTRKCKFATLVFTILDMVSAITEVGGVSRVVYDLTCKPPGTTEWE
ncbi:GMP synthase [glutamine-hydrolyzing]-like [Paramacrobiotus metropolitanus]|uniref:GMP synthase [glutamine-hydrolyzing]-like n=1 Tax=Paramacrobiotus metropolitanus TaxID=2943436 RepID=UPI0024459CB2|nr:GMP synthase [glutamine-hydrolyzing]-like [Paramacrobiotus metropolitanus]